MWLLHLKTCLQSAGVLPDLQELELGTLEEMELMTSQLCPIEAAFLN